LEVNSRPMMRHRDSSCPSSASNHSKASPDILYIDLLSSASSASSAVNVLEKNKVD